MRMFLFISCMKGDVRDNYIMPRMNVDALCFGAWVKPRSNVQIGSEHMHSYHFFIAYMCIIRAYHVPNLIHVEILCPLCCPNIPPCFTNLLKALSPLTLGFYDRMRTRNSSEDDFPEGSNATNSPHHQPS